MHFLQLTSSLRRIIIYFNVKRSDDNLQLLCLIRFNKSISPAGPVPETLIQPVITLVIRVVGDEKLRYKTTIVCGRGRRGRKIETDEKQNRRRRNADRVGENAAVTISVRAVGNDPRSNNFFIAEIPAVSSATHSNDHKIILSPTLYL